MWITLLIGVLVLAAVVWYYFGPEPDPARDEPWRASLEDDDADDGEPDSVDEEDEWDEDDDAKPWSP